MNPLPPPTLENDLPMGLYSEEEKAQILAQIEQAAGVDRMAVEDEFRPRKQGILFPVVVNVAAVALIVGGWFGANAYFQNRQEGLKLKTDRLFSAESKLLSKVLEDAKAQMTAANAEIDKIQGDLKKAAADREGLQKSFEARVAAQDKALRQELEASLASERQRLQTSGLNEAEVAKRLRDYEAQKNTEFNDKLETYRSQAQAQIDQRSQALTTLQAKLQSTVAESEKLRQEYEKQSQEREKALRSQLSSQSADLEALKRDRDELALYFRQADTAVAQVRAAFESRDGAKTQAAAVALRQLLARASVSASESVRTGALAQLGLADAFQAAASAAEDPQAKAEALAQIEAVKTLLKKEQLQSAQLLADNQKALATIEGLRTEVDGLVKRLDTSTSETAAARINLQYLNTKIADLDKSIAELTPFRDRTQTLTRLFTASYPTAFDRFAATFGSPEGALAFPGFDDSWAEVSARIQAPREAKLVRKQALDDVQTFTSYLRGQASAPELARQAVERLSRTDEDYKTVVEGIQALAASGRAESQISTDEVQLYGSVAGTSGTTIVLEALTKVRPQPGDLVELRRVQNKKQTVLGRGPVLTASDQKVEIDWAGNSTRPLSGDAAYLVLP